MHHVVPILMLLVLGIVWIHMLAARWKIAYPILFVVAGFLVSLVPALPRVDIDPDLIFFLILPPILFDAAWSISFKEMKKWWRIIGSFAFLVVFFTALAVALTANYFIPGFTIALGFLLGGIVSPPDAVSTAAITKFVKIPHSTSTILEGESLFNDASSLIIFRFALMAIGTGQFIWQEAAVSFIWMVLGGAAIGFLIGWLFVRLHKKLPTTDISDVVLTLVEPYCMYWVAEQFHTSGVLAVVVGGLYMSSRRLVFLTSAGRLTSAGVRDSIVFLLNGIVFLIIGLELPVLVEGLQKDGIPVWTAIKYGVVVTIVLILARIISAYTAMLATLIFRPGAFPRTVNPRGRYLVPLILGWTGMRGVVSLAAALAIPLTMTNGIPFPQRNLILFITFVAIFLTLVVQGLTLPHVIDKTAAFSRFGPNEEDDERARQKIKTGLKQQVVNLLKAHHESVGHNHESTALIIKQWEERSQTGDEKWMTPKSKALFREILEKQRQYLIELNKDPDIEERHIRQQLYQLDLEEERLKFI